jgi:hypothetical protein
VGPLGVAHNRDHDLTRMFFETVGFRFFVEVEPGDFMMGMIRDR